jgi:hypothetical protein
LNKYLLNFGFFYYSNTAFKQKQGIEVFNLFFKDIPYFLYFTNLKDPKNRGKLSELMKVFLQHKNEFKEPFSFIVMDNDKNESNSLYRTFINKTFNLKETTMKGVEFGEPISYYQQTVTKKIRLREEDLKNKENVLKLLSMKDDDVSLENNYNFDKKILPENMKILNHTVFDFLMEREKSKKKVLILLSKDVKQNREALIKLEELAIKNKDKVFFYMVNDLKNIKKLKDAYKDLDLPTNNKIPEIILINNDNKSQILDKKLILGYLNQEENLKSLNELININ